MSLTLATLIPAIFLLLIGAMLLISNSAIVAMFKAFPRSKVGAGVFFGAGAIWFLYQVAHLSVADFGEFRTQLFIGFAVVALLSFFYVPDFLAVRGACILMLMTAMPLLDAGYMRYDPAQILVYKAVVYVGIALAIYLGAAPYRLRDFFQWLFSTSSRPRTIGGVLLGSGMVLTAIAFTY